MIDTKYNDNGYKKSHLIDNGMHYDIRVGNKYGQGNGRGEGSGWGDKCGKGNGQGVGDGENIGLNRYNRGKWKEPFVL